MIHEKFLMTWHPGGYLRRGGTPRRLIPREVTEG